jgi:PhnB protein
MSKIRKVPKGYHSVTPSLVVKEGLKAVEYYKKVFEAKDQGIMMTPDGKSVAHAELEIGDSKIMLCDEFPQMKCLAPFTVGGTPVSLYLYVKDVDKTFNLALTEGAKVLDPLTDQFWGDRHGCVQDPFGHIWSLATRVKDLTEEEMKKAAEEAFSKKPT